MNGIVYKIATFLSFKVIQDGFLPDEYVCNANEVNKNPEAIKEYMGYCAEVVFDGISVVAVEIATGEVVAVCLNKLQVSKIKLVISAYSAVQFFSTLLVAGISLVIEIKGSFTKNEILDTYPKLAIN